MTLALFTTRPRAIAALATATLAGTALVATGPTAQAAPNEVGPVVEVSNQAEYLDALESVSYYDDEAHTIRISADFALDTAAAPVYEGASDLTIDGGGFTVTGPGTAGDGDGLGFENVFLAALPGGNPELDPEAADPDITIENLTIEDFVTTGAILLISQGSHTLSGVHLRNNGVYLDDGFNEFAPFAGAVTTAGELIVEDSEFTGNGGLLGGAIGGLVIFTENFGSISVSDSVFSDNSAAIGGGILAFGPLSVSNSDFVDNSAETGGAIAALGTTQISGSNFDGNSAELLEDIEITEGLAMGGAIVTGSALEVASSTFQGNSASVGGAIGYDTALQGPAGGDNSALDLTVSASTFEGNSALYGAGAIEVGNQDASDGVQSAAVDISNSTFYANSTESEDDYLSAGAIVLNSLDGYDAALTHNTFASNSGADAAHLAAEIASEGNLSVSANVFAEADGPGCVLPTSATTATNFDADGTCTADWSGAGDIGEGLDPIIDDALALNGGPTRTLLPLSGSPLVDAIALEDGACVLENDQRSVDRPQGDACDIGAVELEADDSVEPVDPEDSAEPIEFSIKTDSGTITGLAYGATAVTNVEWTATADITSTPPAGLVLPLGISGFDIVVPEAGDSVRIELTLPLAVTQVWKVADGDWSQVEDASISGTTIAYDLTDGGSNDEDGTANAVIVDPVAPAVGAAFTG